MRVCMYYKIMSNTSTVTYATTTLLVRYTELWHNTEYEWVIIVHSVAHAPQQHKHQINTKTQCHSSTAIIHKVPTFIHFRIHKVFEFFGSAGQWDDSTRFHGHAHTFALLCVPPLNVRRHAVVNTSYSQKLNHQNLFTTAAVQIRDNTGTGIGTVPARNSVVQVRSRNIFCSGARPCKAFSLDLLPIESINVYLASCVIT